MKKNLIYILIGAAAILTSCKDSTFFKTESPSAEDAMVFASAAKTEQVIAGIYYMFGEQNSYRNRMCGPWVNAGTDCETYVPTAPNYAIYTMDASGHSDITAAQKHPWVYLTQAIERANIAIDGMEKYSDLTKPELAYLYGEALTLRAWCFYEMTKMWGDVPATFAPMDFTDESSAYPKKADRNVIYEQLRKDLKLAAEKMPNSANCPGAANNNVERMNREFALGLLARVDLVYAGKAIRPNTVAPGSGYQTKVFNVTDPAKRSELMAEAMWACDEVIKADGMSKLLPSFEQVFKNICANVMDYKKTETLWEIPFANNVRGQMLNRYGAYANSSAKGHLKHFYKSNAKLVAPTEYVFSFDKNDARRWVTINMFEWKFDAEKTANIDPSIPASTKILYQSPEKINKFYLGKFRAEWLKYDVTNDEDGLNIPVMRFSDVLLMYAEAAIGGIGGDVPSYQGSLTGAQALNAVRSRAGLAAKDSYTMEDIMNERRWEFGGEFMRKYDLMRWGVFSDRLMAAQAHYNNFVTVDGDGNIDFSGTEYDGKLSTDVYFRYKELKGDASYGITEDDRCYVIDEVYGLNLGENDKPEGYISSTETGGWWKVDAYVSGGAPIVKKDNDPNGNRIYGVGMTAEEIEKRQYWPLFNVITSANPNLWNDYDY